MLLYHRVATPGTDPQLLSVAPGRFAEQLGWLRRHVEVVDLEALRRPGEGRRAAITFDDGYADNALAALPALREAGLPATVFVTSGMVGTHREFWWDELERLLLSGHYTGRVDLRVGGRRVWVDARESLTREAGYWALHPRLRGVPTSEISLALNELREQVGAAHAPRDSHRPLSAAELGQLAADPLVTIGAHTISHPLLAALPPQAQRAEITGSRTTLQRLTGEPVNLFAYPYGSPDSFDRETVRAVADAGYQLACANRPGVVARRTSRWTLPRHLVRDWSVDVFSGHVRRWFED